LKFQDIKQDSFTVMVRTGTEKGGYPMNQIYKDGTILMADDDADDFCLVRDALKESGLPTDFQLVADGEELMDYLYRRGKFMNLENASLPCLILLDLNMPRKDGREALTEIKKDPRFRRIPIVVFTTSGSEDDIFCSYELGANSFITKPTSFDDLVEVMKKLGDYWLKTVSLPDQPAAEPSRPTKLSREYFY
jgi:two-component system, response regulator